MKGTVLFYKYHDDRPGGFGFIAVSENRLENHWFGPRAVSFLPGYQPKSGDVVAFDAGEYKLGKGPKCERITALISEGPPSRPRGYYTSDDKIETLQGEFNT